MHRFTASVVLSAGLLVAVPVPSLSQDEPALPNAFESKGERPQADPTVIPAAASELPEQLKDLASPPTLALPDAPEQVRIQELRPLTLNDVVQIAEVNSPSLKAVASQVDQARFSLRAAISAWYPTVDLSANGLPSYLKSFNYRNPDFLPGIAAEPETYDRERRADVSVSVRWDIIDPARVPQIASQRDAYERARASYLIALRDLRLQTASSYFELQEADEGVRIGQASVRASLVSLRDARARFNAGVNTKLEVLEAETQLARDRNLLTDRLASQDLARRSLARR